MSRCFSLWCFAVLSRASSLLDLLECQGAYPALRRNLFREGDFMESGLLGCCSAGCLSPLFRAFTSVVYPLPGDLSTAPTRLIASGIINIPAGAQQPPCAPAPNMVRWPPFVATSLFFASLDHFPRWASSAMLTHPRTLLFPLELWGEELLAPSSFRCPLLLLSHGTSPICSRPQEHHLELPSIGVSPPHPL